MKNSNLKNLNSFLVDMQLALQLNPTHNPNNVIRAAAEMMMSHNLYKDTEAEIHLLNCLKTKRPYDLLRPGLEMHKAMLDNEKILQKV